MPHNADDDQAGAQEVGGGDWPEVRGVQGDQAHRGVPAHRKGNPSNDVIGFFELLK